MHLNLKYGVFFFLLSFSSGLIHGVYCQECWEKLGLYDCDNCDHCIRMRRQQTTTSREKEQQVAILRENIRRQQEKKRQEEEIAKRKLEFIKKKQEYVKRDIERLDVNIKRISEDIEKLDAEDRGDKEEELRRKKEREERKARRENKFQQEIKEMKKNEWLDWEKREETEKATKQKTFEEMNERLSKIDKDLYEKVIEGEIDIDEVKSREFRNQEVRDRILELKEMRDGRKYFEQVIENASVEKESIELASLGKDFATRVENGLELFEGYERYRRRAIHIETALRLPDDIRKKSYSFTTIPPCVINGYDFNAINFISCRGNEAQLALQGELVDSVNDTSELFRTFSDNFHIAKIASAVYQVADGAYEYNVSRDYTNAYASSDLCSKLLNVGKEFAKTVASYVDIPLASLEKTLEKGGDILASYKEKNDLGLKQLRDFLAENAVQEGQVPEYEWEELGEGGVEALRRASGGVVSGAENVLGVCREAVHAIRNPQESFEILKNAANEVVLEISRQALNERDFFQQQVEQANKANEAINQAVGTLVQKPVGELLEGSAEFLTECILMGGAIKAGSVGVSKLAETVKSLSRIASEEVALAESLAVGDANLQKVLCPIKSVLEEAGEITKVATKEGRDFTERVLKIVEENPHIVKKEGALSRAVKQVADIEKKIDWKELLQEAMRDTPEHQREIILKGGDKLIFRSDTGEYAHKIGAKYPHKVEHINIEVQKVITNKAGKTRYSPLYKSHIILDKDKNIIDVFGKPVEKNLKKHDIKILKEK